MKTRAAFWLFYLAALFCAVFGSGCTLIPAPWTRDRGATVDRAEKREEEARLDVLRRAQTQTAIAAAALNAAPASAPVAVAKTATDTAESLQAQSLGAMPEQERQKIGATVAAAVSDDPAAAAKAEKSLAAERKEAAGDAARLASLASALDRARDELRAAYARERDVAALARRLVWSVLGLGLLLLAVLAFALYSRIALGGVGAALHSVGAAAAPVVSAIDGELAKFGQWMIRTGRQSAAAKAAV